MRLAIMQPYFFPYIGYFQLINAVDQFIVYDDVTFIKQGWINRNRFLNQEQARFFTVPLQNVSSHTLIKNTHIVTDNRWQQKLLTGFQQSYARAPWVKKILPLLQEVVCSSYQSIGDMAVQSIKHVCDYLEINTKIIPSSEIYNNQHLSGQERVLDICQQTNCDSYINLPGGNTLYNAAAFSAKNITLKFIQPQTITYRQLNHGFVPWLSIIDVMMFNSPAQIQNFLHRCELL